MFFEKHDGVRRNSLLGIASCESVEENQTRKRCSTRRCTQPRLPFNLRPSSVVRPKTSTQYRLVVAKGRNDAHGVRFLSKSRAKRCGSDDSFS